MTRITRTDSRQDSHDFSGLKLAGSAGQKQNPVNHVNPVQKTIRAIRAIRGLHVYSFWSALHVFFALRVEEVGCLVMNQAN
jgi:hypothetical protein